MSTDFTGVTFSEQKVTPSDDGLLHRAILPDGVLAGCAFSYSGSTLTMAAGSLLICGRQVRHPVTQNWPVVDATSGYARLVLTVDLTRAATKDTFDQVTAAIEYATSADGFSALEQSDINGSGSRYQVEACVVSLGSGGITAILSTMKTLGGFQVYAPADFGLGNVIKTVGSPEDALYNGFYRAPVASEISNGGGGYMSGVVVRNDYGWISQNWNYFGYRVRREMELGVWQPYEWHNPPMFLGVEYRTVERWNNKAVYTKLVAFTPDSLTSQTISLPHDIVGLDIGLSVDVLWKYVDTADLATWRQFPNVYYRNQDWAGQAFFAGPDNIKFELGSTTLSSMAASDENIYVTLRYTKSV